MKSSKINFVKEGEGGNGEASESKGKRAEAPDDESDEDDADFEVADDDTSGSSDDGGSSDESSDGKESESDGDSESDDVEQPVHKDPLAIQCAVVNGTGFQAFSATVRSVEPMPVFLLPRNGLFDMMVMIMKHCGEQVASNSPNEDRLLVDAERFLFGIFDGHGGATCRSVAFAFTLSKLVWIDVLRHASPLGCLCLQKASFLR
jgi:hypothetical protein